MENYKTVRKKKRENLWDLDLTPNEISLNGKFDKLDFITNKNFCSAKDSVKRMKR